MGVDGVTDRYPIAARGFTQSLQIVGFQMGTTRTINGVQGVDATDGPALHRLWLEMGSRFARSSMNWVQILRPMLKKGVAF